jgi:vacuolar protein sorting-associated protein 54
MSFDTSFLDQAKTFLSSYHSQRVTASARLVENELWAAVDTSSEQQHAVGLLIQSAISDPFELLLIPTSPASLTNPSTPPLSAPSSTNDPDKSSSLTTINGGTDSPSGNGKDKDKDKKHLVIEEKTYFVVAATLGSVELLVDYVKIVLNIEMLTTDVMSRLIEYLKVRCSHLRDLSMGHLSAIADQVDCSWRSMQSFNSRTCQVVLGAGAMRSAGLKNITAKHLGSSFALLPPFPFPLRIVIPSLRSICHPPVCGHYQLWLLNLSRS